MGDHQVAVYGLNREQEAEQGILPARTILLTMSPDGFWGVKDTGMRGVLSSFTTAQDALNHALLAKPDMGVWA